VVINQPDIKPFAALVQHIYDEFAGKFGATHLKAIQALE